MHLLPNTERLGRLQRRQDAGQALGQHRLAGARRADHQHVVAAGRRYPERLFGSLLALDVNEIEGPQPEHVTKLCSRLRVSCTGFSDMCKGCTFGTSLVQLHLMLK